MALSLPIPHEVTEALKGMQQMQNEITAIRKSLDRLVKLAEWNFQRPLLEEIEE